MSKFASYARDDGPGCRLSIELFPPVSSSESLTSSTSALVCFQNFSSNHAHPSKRRNFEGAAAGMD